MSHYLNILSWPGLGWFGGIKAIKLYGQVANISYHPETSVDGAQLWQFTPYPHPYFRSSPTHICSQKLLLPISKEAVLGLVQLQEEACRLATGKLIYPRLSWTSGIVLL